MTGAPAEAPALALFDLDGTLLSGDTDALWCDFLIAEGVLDGATFAAANRAIVARYAEGTVGPAEFCAFYASTLIGRTAADWWPLRDRFIVDVVVPRLPDSGRALVDRHRTAGDTLVLTTATNRFLTEPIAAELGIETLIATELEVAHGRFTGRNTGVLNMREGKPARLRSWMAEQGMSAGALESAAFYSDSINDLPLLTSVGKPVAIDPDSRLRAEAALRGWPVLVLPR